MLRYSLVRALPNSDFYSCLGINSYIETVTNSKLRGLDTIRVIGIVCEIARDLKIFVFFLYFRSFSRSLVHNHF